MRLRQGWRGGRDKKRTELLEPGHQWAGACFQETWWIESWQQEQGNHITGQPLELGIELHWCRAWPPAPREGVWDTVRRRIFIVGRRSAG